MIKLYKGDCLEIMDKLIAEGVKVDAIITDPPYGTTACKWDSIIPFDKMWERLNKLIKPNCAIVLFGSEPFSSALRMSNIKNYKYDWIWDKRYPTNYALAKKHPMKRHEIISVFNSKIYNPQMIKRDIPIKKGKNEGAEHISISGLNKEIYKNKLYTHQYPVSIQFFPTRKEGKSLHPTQKPVPLLEYLIKTYTNEKELVLDFTMGSGTTGVACVNTNRNFIGIELDDNYFEIAKNRINDSKS